MPGLKHTSTLLIHPKKSVEKCCCNGKTVNIILTVLPLVYVKLLAFYYEMELVFRVTLWNENFKTIMGLSWYCQIT